MTTRPSSLEARDVAGAAALPKATRSRTLPLELAPICVLVFLEFLTMGLPLPVLPLHVHGALGFGSLAVGVVIGAQSWATLLTRHIAGTRSDRRGPRSAVVLGLLLSAAAGVLYALSTLAAVPVAQLSVLLLGRVVLGAGESLVVTGALSWGMALAGRERSGAVMSWVGVAMYGALAAGAPLGSELASRAGFVGLSLAAAASPLLGLLAAALARNVEPAFGARLPFQRVLRTIALPGSGLALAALGFGALAAFSTLRFAERGLTHAPLAMAAFGATYVLARVLFGGLPDRYGGARVAMVSALVTATGQFAMWLASSSSVAVLAAALTGLGFSLVFPAFGIEAVRQVPPQNRGVAIGAYAACFDLSLGVGVPLLGALVGLTDYGAAFVLSGSAALASFAIAVALATRARKGKS